MREGKKNGLGTMFYADGGKFVGNWLNDKYQGGGTLYNKTGDIVKTGLSTND